MLKSSLKSIIESIGIYKTSSSDAAYFRERPRDPFLHQQYLINSHYKKVTTIFDIGSFIGNTVDKYRSLFPEATIYSFEPFPESYKKLGERFEADNLVKRFNAAVADKAGTRQFFVRGRNDANSLLPSVTAGQRYDHTEAATINTVIDVPVTTIDDVCRKESLPEIQVLKMDMEGGELMALRGAMDMLSQHLIGLIYTEVTFVPHNQDEPLFHEIVEFLSSYGYTLFDIYSIIRARNGQVRRADTIFVSPQLREVVDALDPMP